MTPGPRGACRTFRRALLIAAVAPAPLHAHPLHAHPLHASFAELSYEPATREVRVELRVFADDFAAVVIRRTGVRPDADGLPPEAAMLRYVAARFTVAIAGGAPLGFRGCGVRRDGAQLVVCLRAAVRAPAGARVHSAVLTDAFPDQVNIVRASWAGRRQTLLFTAGAGAKAL